MSACGPKPAAALLVALLALPGCALQPVAVEPHKALLTQMPERVPHASPGAAALLVFAPHTRPLYDSVRMAYQLQAQEVDYFSRNQWAETPSEMLKPLLVKTLQDTGFFSAVITPPYSGPYAWGLRTEIGELVADFTADPAVLRLSLRLQLIDGKSGRVVATRDLAMREPLRQRTPEACIAAANAATAQALLEVARFVVETAH